MGGHGLVVRETGFLSSIPLLMSFASWRPYLISLGLSFLICKSGTVDSALECLVPIPYPIYSQAQGVVKDLEPELLLHLAQGTASLLISTKGSPQGELRGQVGSSGGGSELGWHPVSPCHLLSPSPGGWKYHTALLPGRMKPYEAHR